MHDGRRTCSLPWCLNPQARRARTATDTKVQLDSRMPGVWCRGAFQNLQQIKLWNFTEAKSYKCRWAVKLTARQHELSLPLLPNGLPPLSSFIPVSFEPNTGHWQKANPATFCGISGLNWGNHGGAWWVLKLTLGGDWDSMAGKGSWQVVVLVLLARKLIAVQRYGHRSCQMVQLVCFQSLLMWSNWAGSHKSKFCVPFQREGT